MKKNNKKENIVSVDTKKLYTIKECSETLPKISSSKFIGSIDIDIVLNLKQKNLKDTVRGSIVFPNQVGEEKKIYVLCEEKDEKKALESGADKVGLNEIEAEIMNGNINFDVLIATSSVMPKIVKLAKTLGPKGLMPNPKNGTVTDDMEKAIQSFKSGKVNFKTAQDQPVIRLKVGNLQMNAQQLEENITEAIKSVYSEAKKYNTIPFKKITLSPTIGAGLKLDISDIIKNI